MRQAVASLAMPHPERIICAVWSSMPEGRVMREIVRSSILLIQDVTSVTLTGANLEVIRTEIEIALSFAYRDGETATAFVDRVTDMVFGTIGKS